MRVWFLVFLLAFAACNIQNKQEQLDLKIDALFEDYVDGPGCALGVIKDGEFIFTKGYGYANLDYDIPNEPDSKFYIGSMAKQFCGAALLKLESEGLIDFQEPIIKYLDDFPEYEEVITIDHIIHHTSGIRGTSSMQLIAGIDQNFEEHFTADQQYEMIKSQKELNFSPGSEYRYSSGGYIVLAKLVEKVSGLSFRDYLDKHIFQPLGMDDTFVIDDHHEIVKNRVISYFPKGNGFERRSMIFDGMGDGSILTTVNDLLKWDQAFYDDSLLGIDSFAERMYETGKVLSRPGQYYGMALQTQDYKGHKMVAHNGGMLAFRADMVRFPDEELTIIVLANHAYIHSSYKALQVADLFLEDKNLPTDTTKHPFDAIAEGLGKSYSGKYFSDEINNWRRISYENDTLYYDSGDIENRIPLRRLEKDRFGIDVYEPAAIISFEEKKISVNYGGMSRSFEKFDDTQPGFDDLEKFRGKYYSEELNTYYQIYRKEDRLYLKVNNKRPIIIYLDPTDPRINWNSKTMVWIGYAMMKFQLDEAGQVSGFLIGDNRINGIFFQKID